MCFEITEIKGISCIESVNTTFQNYVKTPDDVNYIMPNAFENCIIKKIEIGPDVTIAPYAFSNAQIGEIIMQPPKDFFYANLKTPFRLQADSFLQEHSFSNAHIGKITLPEGIRFLPIDCFSETTIFKIILPDSLEKIDARCFYCCKNLKQINLPKKLNVINNDAFYASDLEEIIIPKNVSFMGRSIFAKSKLKKAVVNSKELHSLSEYIFSDCTLLREINFIDTINLKSIGTGAFSNTPSLDVVILPKGIRILGWHIFENSGIKLLILPESLKTFSSYALDKINDNCVFCVKNKKLFNELLEEKTPNTVFNEVITDSLTYAGFSLHKINKILLSDNNEEMQL